MSWPPCLSERFITPSLRAAFDSLPRRADVDTVVAFLADQFVGDFDGMAGEFAELARTTADDSESDTSRSEIERQGKRRKVKSERKEVDTPFRLRVLYLLHSGARTQARKEVEARMRSQRPAKRRNRRKTPAGKRAQQASKRRLRPPSSNATAASAAASAAAPSSDTRYLNPQPLDPPSPTPASLASSPLTTPDSSRSPSAFLSPSSISSPYIPTPSPPGPKPSKRRRAAPESQAVCFKRPKHSGSTSNQPGCTSCRTLRRRCDREDPCEHCERTGRECVYPPPLTSTARRRLRQRAKIQTIQTGEDDATPADVHVSDEGAQVAEHSEQLQAEDPFDSERDSSPPTPKTVKRQSIPFELKKTRRKLGRMSMVDIDNSLLALLGRPLQPNLPDGKPRKETVISKSKRIKAEEGHKAHPTTVDARGGILSSTFAAVMRLVAELGPARPARRTIKLPAPARAPPVWAQSRQELCEALPYYRAFQSGMYMYKRVPFGYLLDGFPSPRDVWADHGRVIISHGGGQAVRVTDAWGKVSVSLAADHTRDDARIDTLVLAAQRRSPVILLAGEGYALLPWQLGCAYAVLGWYWVSCTWYEAEPCAQNVEPPDDRPWFRRLKVRFDWIDTQGTPWWLTEGTPWVVPGDMVATTEDVRLPPTPVSPCKELRQPIEVTPVKMPIHQLILPPTPPLDPPLDEPLDPPMDPPLRRLCEVSRDREAGDASAIWTRTPTRVIDPAPFDDLYFSPLEIHRGSRLPGDHLLANCHADPPPKGPWRHAGERCPTCANHSPRLYVEGWTCLDPECTQFWMLSTAVGLVPIPSSMRLSYVESFLQVGPTPFEATSLPYGIVPPPPSSAPEAEAIAEAGSRSLWRGFVCTCGRSNCRYRWECLSCRACGRQIAAQTDSDVVAASVIKHDKVDPLGEADEGSPDLAMSVRRLSAPRATVVAYELPQVGTVFHVMHDTTNAADTIWEAYQRAAIQTSSPLFQRRALKTNTVKGQLLSQQFAINSGASYKYIVETLSYPFSDSPRCVMNALDVIHERVASVLGETVEFNEILSVMYREGQKMNWHDDGEHGLGPVVAALSLGAPAVMSFRPKSISKVHRGGGLHRGVKPTIQPPPVLNLTLSHGDVVIMAGRAIQYGYDHRVIPAGLRVAATARVVRGATPPE